jgi:coproporphyrinogen III oxidase-like Fe-S oxidoreductase
MLTFESLAAAGLDLDPANHSFTYTYPPARVAKRDARSRGLAADQISAWPDYSLYLHIPFCLMSCRFCSLHRELISGAERVSRYDAALLHEIQLFCALAGDRNLHSLFVGGGTPTSMFADSLARLISEATASATTPIEITVECAPDESRSGDDWSRYFATLRSLDTPVSRLSIGVESAHEVTLSHMGRRGGRDAILQVAGAADECFDAYNVDLLLGYPDQPVYSGTADAARVISAVEWLRSQGFRLPNISIYQMWDVGFVPATRRPSTVRAAAHEVWRAKSEVQRYLFDNGYMPAPGCTYTSDMCYAHQWTRHRCFDFRHIGLGSGSYSFLPNGFSQRNRDIDSYVAASESASGYSDLDDRVSKTYVLNDDEREIRRVILGLRSTDWTSAPTERPGTRELCQKLGLFESVGILERHGDAVRLGRDSFAWSNEISAALHPADTPRTWRGDDARR